MLCGERAELGKPQIKLYEGCVAHCRKPISYKGMDFVKKITNSLPTSLTDCWQSIRFFT